MALEQSSDSVRACARRRRGRPIKAAGPAIVLIAFLTLVAPIALAQQSGPAMPMHPVYEDGAAYRQLQKPVLKARLLDDMTDLAHWSFQGVGTMAISREQVRQGQSSLRIASTDNIGRVEGEGDWQDLVATRNFPSEDWSAYNRISLWVYPDVHGAPAVSVNLTLHNEGAHVLPDDQNEGRDDSIPLRNHGWNHVTWEIAPLDRDKITGLSIGYALPKMFPDPGDQSILYIDQLELQTVNPDHVEGWDVAPGTIAYSQAGYLPGTSKIAVASSLVARTFSLLDKSTGKPIFSGPIAERRTDLGVFQMLDFTSVDRPGTYILRAGDATTRPFRIGDDVWSDSIWKVINFMYSERCGTVIPGVHGICHQDDYTVHGDRRIVVNGGYHDAGDLSETGHTPAMAYALFELADRLQQQGEDPALRDRAIEEAKWGLNWVLKTRFGDGFRSTGQNISYWTDGIMGDADDRFGPAVNDPEWNFRAASLEALAARILKTRDPELARRSLTTAEEDWKYAAEGLKNAAPIPDVYGQNDDLERISFGAIASVDLFEATGNSVYAEEAIALGSQIVASQERTLQSWLLRLTGYFYTGPDRKNLFHRFHQGEEEQPIVALEHLCRALPNDPHWMDWYSAIVLHARYYQQAAATADAPWDMLPAGIYRLSEAEELPQSASWRPLETASREAFAAEVKQGLPLGGEFYLRRYPVWFQFRGNSSVLLSSAKALSAAAQLREDVAGEDLAQEQAQWILGRNPFAASIMYGEGYDWTPLYSIRSGQMVGALPVGIETKGVADSPYWPNQICWTYKEVWVQPAADWIWLMNDLSGPAVIRGVVDMGSSGSARLVNERSHQVFNAAIAPDATFRAAVPQGSYRVEFETSAVSVTALSASSESVDLRHGHAVTFHVASSTAGSADVVVHLSIEGAGRHTFSIRSSNLDVADPMQATVDLGAQGKQEIAWHLHVKDASTPWVAVVLKDGSLGGHAELSGTL